MRYPNAAVSQTQKTNNRLRQWRVGSKPGKAILHLAMVFTMLALAACGGGIDDSSTTPPPGGGYNSKPSISGVPAPANTVYVGKHYQYTPSVYNGDDDPLTFSIANKPAWAAFNTANGTLSGSPAVADRGLYQDIVITVSDGKDTDSTTPFSIRVKGIPTISGTAPPAYIGVPYSFKFTINNPESAWLEHSTQWLLTPPWYKVNASTGEFTGTPVLADRGNYYVQYKITDGTNFVSKYFTLTVTDEPASAPPTISGTPKPSVEQDVPYVAFTPTATDPEGDSLVFLIANKPSWASFDSATGTLSGTPGAAHVGDYTNIIISVFDGTSTVSLPAFIITVTNVNDAPTISGTPGTIAAVGKLYQFIPSASDPDTGDTLTFSITTNSVAGPPAWASFDAATGKLSGTPAIGNVAIYSNIIISVSDSALSASLPAFNLEVKDIPNSPPNISGAPDTSVYQDQPYSFTPTAADGDGDPLTFSITTNGVAGPPTWASFTTTTGQLGGTPDNSHVGVYNNIVITVTDGTTPISLPAFNITVVNVNDAPTITGTSPQSATEDAPYSFTPTGSDPDGDTLLYSVASKPDWLTFDTGTGNLSGTPANADVAVYSITIGVTDGALSDSMNLVLEVINANDPPVISGTPAITVAQDQLYTFTPGLTDLDVGDTHTFSITTDGVAGAPAWASFNSGTGKLSGTPGNSHVGIYNNIVISVSDGTASDSLPAFNLTVTNVNDPPVISGTPGTTVTVGQSYSFTPTGSDPDAADTLTYSITTNVVAGPPTWAGFSTGTGALTGAPAMAHVGTYNNIVISVSDGKASDSLPAFSITVDAVLQSISVTPAGPLTRNENDQVQFTATGNYGGGNTLDITNQVDWNSSDDYIAYFSMATGSEGLMTALDGGTAAITATMVAAGISSNSVSLTVNYPTTTGDLIINEVGSVMYSNSTAWLEVYNRSAQKANLGLYQLRTNSYYYDAVTSNYVSGGRHTFALPQVTVPPGGYVIIRGEVYAGAHVNTRQVVYIRDDAALGRYPLWYTSGMAELLLAGATSDFARWGTETTAPTTTGEWTTGAAPTLTNEYGLSLARDGISTDTNAPADWVLRTFATPGGPNDVTCTTDTDLDGIPDCSEQAGGTFAGLPLYDWGARVNQPDIFFEVDYMQSADEAVTPRQEALQKVKDVFAARGYTVHFDVGDLYHNTAGISPLDMDLGGGDMVPYTPAISFGIAAGYGYFYDYKLNFMDNARKQIFHYMLFANSQIADGSCGSGGIAELFGNDLIVSLGGCGLNSTTTTQTNFLINAQATTVFHELGHNLGLHHGGGDSINAKPNYISNMNYMYSFEGLPEAGTSTEADRYYWEIGCTRYITSRTQFTNPPTGSPATFRMDYSDGLSQPLIESAVNESTGLGRTGSGSVDFDCDGIDDGTITYAYNLNPGYSTNSTETLTDYDDWGNIKLFFQKYPSGDNEMVSLEPKLVHDPVGHDRQPYIVEPPRTPRFLKELKETTQMP